MTQQIIPATTCNSGYPHLLLVKGRIEYEQQLRQLSGLCWQIAYAALWNGKQFSGTEKQTAIDFMLDFIRNHPDTRKGYMEFVQRVLLARQYHILHPDCFPLSPAVWFHPESKRGFSRTGKWFNAVETAREDNPAYKAPLRCFGEAIRVIRQSHDTKEFHYWRNYFIGHNCQGLLNLFLSIHANMKSHPDQMG